MGEESTYITIALQVKVHICVMVKTRDTYVIPHVSIHITETVKPVSMDTSI